MKFILKVDLLGLSRMCQERGWRLLQLPVIGFLPLSVH